MARYKKAELERMALALIENSKICFIVDLVAKMPISKSTFYNKNLDKLDTIKEALDSMKVQTKMNLRAKWYNSNNATVQIALYKLLASKDEAARLNGTDHSHTVDVNLVMGEIQEWSDIPIEDRKRALSIIKTSSKNEG